MKLRYRFIQLICIVALLSVSLPVIASSNSQIPHPPDRGLLPKVDPPPSAELIDAQLVRVIDGDTLLLRVDGKNHLYQTLGANAPELSPKSQTPAAQSAQRYLARLLEGEHLSIHHDPKGIYDTNNKRAAYIYRAPDMLLVNLELVRLGFAKHDDRFGSLHLDAFAYYNSLAQELEKGVWGSQEELFDQSTPSKTQQPAPKQTPESIQKTSTSDDRQDQNIEQDQKEQIKDQRIYITKSGSSYHLKDCPHLTNSTRETTRDKIRSTHTPCKTCQPEG